MIFLLISFSYYSSAQFIDVELVWLTCITTMPVLSICIQHLGNITVSKFQQNRSTSLGDMSVLNPRFGYMVKYASDALLTDLKTFN